MGAKRTLNAIDRRGSIARLGIQDWALHVTRGLVLAWSHISNLTRQIGDREVMRSELGLADRLHDFADAVELGDYTIPDEFDVRREAFSCARGCKICSCRG
jgi:hypothetical protein